MAPRPTPEETAARHRAKLADHDFVPRAGSRLCDHRRVRIDENTLSMAIIGSLRGTGSQPAPQTVRCNLPRHKHR